MRLLAACALLLVVSCAPPRRRAEVTADPRPDTSLLPAHPLGGIRRPLSVIVNETNGHVYVAGEIDDSRVLILDAATGRQLGSIPETGDLSLWLNPITNRLYVISDWGHQSRVVVVDCSADTVLRRIEDVPLAPLPTTRTEGYPWCVNLTNHKVYAIVARSGSVEVAIADGRSGRMLGSVPLASFPHGLQATLLWNPARNVVYVNDGETGDIVVIDGTSNRAIARIEADCRLYPMCVNPSGNKLYAGTSKGDDSSVVVIDGRTSRISAWVGAGRGFESAVFHTGCNKLYIAAQARFRGPSHVTVVDGRTDRVLKRIVTPGDPRVLVTDSAGNRLFCTGSGWVGVIDCASDSLTAVIRLGRGFQHAAYYAPARRLYCSDWELGDVFAVHADDFATVDTVSTGYRVQAMIYNEQQDKLYCANDHGHTLAVASGESGRPLASIAVGLRPAALALDQAGERLYCANEADSSLSVIDCREDRVVNTIPLPCGPRALHYSPGGNRLFCAGGSGGEGKSRLVAVDCRSNTVVAARPVSGTVRLLAYDPARGRVFCVTVLPSRTSESKGLLTAFDATTLDRLYATQFAGYGRAAAYDPAHDRLYVSHAYPFKVTAFDCRTGRVVANAWAGNAPWPILFNPKLNRLYGASTDRVSGGGTNDNPDSFPGTSTTAYAGTTVAVLDTDCDSTIAEIPVPMGPRALCLAEATNRLYCACNESLFVLDCATGRRVASFAAQYPQTLSYSARHGSVLVADWYGSGIVRVDDATLTINRR
jgi:DNA-binding beta-propeller fold protein YncE